MIFLDLTKAYDALDRSRCLEILEGYGVGPNARRLLTTYWRRLIIQTFSDTRRSSDLTSVDVRR